MMRNHNYWIQLLCENNPRYLNPFFIFQEKLQKNMLAASLSKSRTSVEWRPSLGPYWFATDSARRSCSSKRHPFLLGEVDGDQHLNDPVNVVNGKNMKINIYLIYYWSEIEELEIFAGVSRSLTCSMQLQESFSRLISSSSAISATEKPLSAAMSICGIWQWRSIL